MIYVHACNISICAHNVANCMANKMYRENDAMLKAIKLWACLSHPVYVQ